MPFNFKVDAWKYGKTRIERREIETNDRNEAWKECLHLRAQGFQAFVQRHMDDDWWTGIPDSEF